MRQQQNNQNRRMRGRGNGSGGSNGGSGGNGGGNNNNNNRKGPNPLTRSYESNGPDVKVRGTAQHVAEKYMTLARDAQSSGDRVMAENYLQHAEHYNRIIAAAYAANPPQAPHQQNDSDEEGNEGGDDRFQSNPQPMTESTQPYDGNSPQPVIDGLPAEVAMADDGKQHERQANSADAAEAREPRNNSRRRPRAARAPLADDAVQASSDDDVSRLPAFIVQPERVIEPTSAED